jgi:hypothetical protein
MSQRAKQKEVEKLVLYNTHIMGKIGLSIQSLTSFVCERTHATRSYVSDRIGLLVQKGKLSRDSEKYRVYHTRSCPYCEGELE